MEFYYHEKLIMDFGFGVICVYLSCTDNWTYELKLSPNFSFFERSERANYLRPLIEKLI